LDPVVGHEQGGKRPVVVISHEEFNKTGTVIALVVTSRNPRLPFPLSLEVTSVKLPKQSWVKIGQIRTLSVVRLGKKLGRLSEAEVDQLVEGLSDIVGS
jgi:mRNA interferase MazF